MRTRKVLVCGAFSTGKTTLVTALADRAMTDGRAVTVCPDVARSCPLPLNREQTLSSTIWLASEQIRREVEAVHSGRDLVLCDRGLPDILSHQALVRARQNDELTSRFVAFARAWSRTYDVVLRSRVDHGIPVATDGLRLDNEAYRRELELSLVEELYDAGLEFETLSGDLEADVGSVLRRCYSSGS